MLPTAVKTDVLDRQDASAAVGVLARGMRDNPIHIAAFGDDPDIRIQALERLFAALFDGELLGRPLCARVEGELAAVIGDRPPGSCGRDVHGHDAAARRAVHGDAVETWLAAWDHRDLAAPHAHCGPFAVDAHLQGRGIGSLLLAA